MSVLCAASERGTVMAESRRVNTRARLDHDQVEPQWQARRVGGLQPAPGRLMQARPLPVIDGLLGQAKVPARPPPHLDDHEGAGWPRVDRDQVELRPPDVDLPGEDRPAGVREATGDRVLGGVSRPLLARAHEAG